MGTGYTRQSDPEIDDGETIYAIDLDNEFDAIQTAFDATVGHSHDGTSGEGPKISLTTSISGILPISNGGTGGINNLSASTAPTINEDLNDGYVVGSLWVNTTSDITYICVDSTVGAAVWQRAQVYDTDLAAIAALTSAANKLPYATGAGTWALTDFSAYGRTLVDDADAATARTTLGLVIGTNVQAYDADLTTWAGITPASGVGTFLATPTSANLASAVTDETGSGALVFGTSPTLVTPALGTPSSGVLTNTTGLPVSTGISGLGAGMATFLATPTSANLAATLTDETGTGANVFANSPTLVTPALGTPSAAVLTNATGLPISTGVTGLGTGVATFLATPSSANLAAAVTGETGSGALVFGTSPTITGGTITGITDLALADGGTGASLTDPNADRIMFWDDSAGAVTWLTAGTGLTITGTTIDGTAADFTGVAYLNVADQTVTGGARVTSLSDGTKSSGTYTPDPGDRPMIHITNGGAFTLAPGTNVGYYLLDITNNGSAGTITTSGWTKVAGDPFTTTNTNKFRCSCSIGDTGSLLVVQAMQ